MPESLEAALAAHDGWRGRLRSLAEAGAILVPIDLPVMANLRVLNGAILAMEAAVYHAPMLRERSADYGEFARLRLLTLRRNVDLPALAET